MEDISSRNNADYQNRIAPLDNDGEHTAISFDADAVGLFGGVLGGRHNWGPFVCRWKVRLTGVNLALEETSFNFLVIRRVSRIFANAVLLRGGPMAQEEDRRKRRFHELWVNCAAAEAAYEQLRNQPSKFKELTEMGPGLLARIRGRQKKGVIRKTTPIQLANIEKFSSICGISPKDLLVNGDGLSPTLALPASSAPLKVMLISKSETSASFSFNFNSKDTSILFKERVVNVNGSPKKLLYYAVHSYGVGWIPKTIKFIIDSSDGADGFYLVEAYLQPVWALSGCYGSG
jgi:hypothetical protein